MIEVVASKERLNELFARAFYRLQFGRRLSLCNKTGRETPQEVITALYSKFDYEVRRLRKEFEQDCISHSTLRRVREGDDR